MTNTTNKEDLIRKAAEYVGWAYILERRSYQTFDIGYVHFPLDRWALHALTGLVEDKVREGENFSLITFSCGLGAKIQFRGQQEIYVEHEDPLIARLGALMQLVEKIDG